MFELFINNFIALAKILIISVITVVTFLGTLLLISKYIDFCFEHIKNYYLRHFVLFIVSPLTLAFLVSFVLSIFGVSLVN